MPAEYIPNLAYRFNRRCIHGNSYNWMIFKKMRNQTFDSFIVKMGKAIIHGLVSSRRVRINQSPYFLFARTKPLYSTSIRS